MGIIERRVVIIGLIVYIALGVAAWFLLYQPRINARRKAAKEIAELRKELEETRSRIAQLPRLRVKKEQLEQEIGDIWSRIVPRSEMLGLLRRISREAEGRRVHFLEIIPPGLDTLLQVEGPTVQVRPVPFLVTVQGRYLDVGRYLQNLGGFQYFVRVPDVDINARDDIRPEVEAKLLLNIYVSSLAGGGSL